MTSNRTCWAGFLSRLLALGLVIQTAGCVQKLDPLAIKEVEPGKPAIIDPSLAAAAGNLNITRNGKTRIPYPTGLNGGCVAAAVLLWLPLDVLLGGTLGPGPDCDQYLPRLTLIQLESRRAAVLQAQKYGDFVAQLPVGTYLVAQVIDDKFIVPVRFGFQIAKADEAYDLGVIAVEDGANPSATVTPHADAAFAQLMAQLPAAESWPKSTALFTQISSAPSERSSQVVFFDKKDLDAYLTAATLELKDKGMALLSPAELAPSPAAQPVPPSGAQAASAPAVSSGPMQVPITLDFSDMGPYEGMVQLEGRQLSGTVTVRNTPINVDGRIEPDQTSVSLIGSLSAPAIASHYTGCSATGTSRSTAGRVTIMVPVTCSGYMAPAQVNVTLELPSAS